jgi:hypothetical protein
MKTDKTKELLDDITAQQENAWDDLLIHAWVSQLMLEASGLYVSRQNARSMPMQTGQALLGFLQVFGNVKDEELHRLIQSLHRFTESDDPFAVILFKALVNLSTEHDTHGDFMGSRAPDIAERPRSAAIWMRESLERWCDWIDAVIHLQTHSQWHLAPEYFDPDPDKREQTTRAINQRYLEQMRRLGMADWRSQASDSTQVCKEMPTWQILPPPAISQPQRPWPHPELDEAIITLWPLVKRHNWSYTDLLNVLRDLVDITDAYPSQSDSNLATYCTRALHLRKAWLGKTAKMDRPVGYVIALRLCPPVLPPPATFGNLEDIEPTDFSRMEPFEFVPENAADQVPVEPSPAPQATDELPSYPQYSKLRLQPEPVSTPENLE